MAGISQEVYDLHCRDQFFEEQRILSLVAVWTRKVSCFMCNIETILVVIRLLLLL